MRGTKEIQPFRFLDLPKEIRLLVYEALPRSLKHHQFRHPDEPAHRLTVIFKSFPVGILATCSLIYDEARPIVMATASSFVRDAPPRIIDGMSGRGEGRMLDALIRAVVRQMDALGECRVAGEAPCLKLEQLFDGHLRNALMGKRNSRFLVKFVHQAAHHLRCSPLLVQSGQGQAYRAIELVKYTSATEGGIGRYWTLGTDLHALNERLRRVGVAVACRGVLSAGAVELGRGSGGLLVPQAVDFQAYGLGCYIPPSRQMEEGEWVDEWME